MVQVFLLKLEDDMEASVFDRLVDSLPQSSQQRILDTKGQIKARQRLISEILIRSLAAESTSAKARDIQIERDKFGKPFIVGLKDFHYNYSHSRDWLACAISDQPVGIDIEMLREISIGLAKRYFTDKEYSYITSAPAESQLQRFYQLWGMKEAYVKMLGQGLRIELNTFSICIGDHDIFVESQDTDTSCFFQQINILENYMVSLCSKKSEKAVTAVIMDQSKLIADFLQLL